MLHRFLKKRFSSRKLQVTYGWDTCRDMAPCATMFERAVHLPRALTASLSSYSSFILSSYNLTNISKFMRFYLISLACTNKPISLCALFAASPRGKVALYMFATSDPPGIPHLSSSSFFLSASTSDLYSFFRFVHFNISISISFYPKETGILSHIRNSYNA